MALLTALVVASVPASSPESCARIFSRDVAKRPLTALSRTAWTSCIRIPRSMGMDTPCNSRHHRQPFGPPCLQLPRAVPRAATREVAKAAMSAAAAAVAAGLSSPSGALVCSGSTGGADSLETSVPRPATAQPRLPAQEGASQPAVGDRPGFAKQFEWNRPSGGWWCEQATRGVGTDDVASKVTVICGRPAGRGFVQFLEAGEEVFEESGFRLAGAFVKVAGPHSARHFKLPAVGLEGFSEEELQHMLAPIHFWVKGVPPGGLVLFALLDIAPDAMPHVLEALAPLGVPQVPPPRDMRALAAVGWCAGSSESLGEAGAAGPRPADRAFTTHAAADVAYASMPRAIVAAEAAAATGVVAPV
mmetsp:Transcript_61270/g.164828  ORF Transcript_61270/g.164828 Transcript_61270/m.164828 type:complete len:360 (-) Transcript_61270:39-1118(-)